MDLTDEELVRMIREQDDPVQSAEMSQIIYRYSRMIRVKASKLGGKVPAEADDLIQEGFLGLLGAVKTYRQERGSFSAYAGVCVENRMRSAMRSASGIAETDYDFEQLSDEHLLTEELVILKERNSELFKKLEKMLSNREFTVLRLYLAGFSYREIAAKLSLTVKSVDNSLERVRRKLKCLL